jgi:heme-degrading monooxygenase HmoA
VRQRDTVFLRLWEYNVVEGRETDFERIYAADGDWVRLFAASDGYLGTELFRCLGELRRYITAQRPVSRLRSRRVRRR